MPRLIRPLTLLATVAAGFALLAAPALAAPSWTAATTYPLPPGADPQLAQVGYQFGGQATVAFTQAGAGAAAPATLDAGVVTPGRGYAQQLQLAAASGTAVASVSLAVALNGAAVLAWEVAGSGASVPAYSFLASYRPAGGGAWSAPVTVATDSSRVAGITPRLVSAISPGGTAAVAVEHLDPSLTPAGYRLDVITYAPSGAAAAPLQLGPGGGLSVEGAALGYDDAGDLTAVFDAGQPGGDYALGEQQLPAGGSWSAFQELAGSTPGEDAGLPSLGVAADGSAVVAFGLAQAGGAAQLSAVTRTGSGGAWSPATTLVAALDATPLGAGISSGDVADVLYSLAGGAPCAGVVRAQLGGTWTAPACIAAAGGAPAAGAVTFLGPDAYLAWSTPAPAGGVTVQSSRWLQAGAAPDPATSLDSGSGLSLTGLVGDGDGGVAAFWSAASALRVSAFDAGGPILLASNVPTVQNAERDTTMSVTFADLWSGVASISWNFGDQSPAADAPYANGAQVSHAYAAPGTYTVTATAADAAGNVTRATFEVTVTPPVPELTKLRQSATVWREAKPPPRARLRKLPIGTRFSLRLSEAAAVSLRFERAATGRRVGATCLPEAPPYASAPPCTYEQTVATISFSGRHGLNRLKFDGLVPGGHRLAPGRYTVAASASESGESSGVSSLSFTIAGR